MDTNKLQLILTDQFAIFIKNSEKGKRLTPSGTRISKGTLTNYRLILALLQEFEELQGASLRIKLLNRASPQLMRREQNYWKRFFRHFTAFLYQRKGYYDQYVLSVIKGLKTFFNYLQNEKGYMIGSFHKQFRVPFKQNSPVVLTPAQVNFMITNEAFRDSLSPVLKRVREILIIGCTVGLRVSDLLSLKRKHIIELNGKEYLSLFTKKTGTEVRIPLPEYALDIFHKYIKKGTRTILPSISVTNLNIQLKKLVRKAGWTYIYPKYISYKGKMREIRNPNGSSWSFYQHITAHTMRKTAITTLLTMGVPENLVRKVSGHAEGSKEFHKYVGLAQEYLNKEVSDAYKRLLIIDIL